MEYDTSKLADLLMADSQINAQTAAKIAVSYPRVSSKKQAEKDGDPDGYSLPAQREANRRKAATLGAVVVEEFVERAESAKSADRPKLQEMLSYIRQHKVDYVIVHKIDRLARNRADDVEISLAIKQAGAELVSATENIDETPNGMLLHGIMSAIAEFYSRNLAVEVTKGMTQKAKIGGTPGKAPLGYLNVQKITANGSQVRTVDIDPVRAPLITWAFHAYASGDWTLKALAAELEQRGLTTRPTPKTPARPIKYNSLHKILTTPYYKGIVVFSKAAYPGKHKPLIDEVTWAKVQEVLSSHATGEKQREHPHYLKSSVFCGNCDSRLVITNAKNPSGTVYPYFICLGRHQKITDCEQKAVLIAKVEQQVADYYRAVQLDPESRGQIETMLRDEMATYRTTAEIQHKQLSLQKDRLERERTSLLQAHYAQAVPLDLLKAEQDRIARSLAEITERLTATNMEFEQFERALTSALDYAMNCHRAYIGAAHVHGGNQIRRLLNQAIFTRLYIDDEGIHGDLTEPFRTLLSDELTCAAEQHAANKEGGMAGDGKHRATSDNDPRTSLAEVLEKTNKKPDDSVASLKLTTLVPSAGFEPATPALGEPCSIP